MTRRVWIPAVAVGLAVAANAGVSAVSLAAPTAPAASAKSNTAPCGFATVTACQSTDPAVKTYVGFSGGTSGCTFNFSVSWGDSNKTQQVSLTNPPDGTVFLASHRYAYRDTPMTFTITVNGQAFGGCSFGPFTLYFTLLPCTSSELSGSSWASRFPDSKSAGTLSGGFRADVSKFAAAMRSARIKVRTISTRRPRERAYLMHYSWLVAKRKLSPLHVPYFAGHGKHAPPVGICWVHAGARGANIRASIAAARRLAAAFGIDSLRAAPLLTSLRTEGLAIVMSTTWTSRKIRILDAAGHPVTIRSRPRDGLNKTLIAVGATYGVLHFRHANQAPNVWSVNGH